jgi:hypothetical protein
MHQNSGAALPRSQPRSGTNRSLPLFKSHSISEMRSVQIAQRWNRMTRSCCRILTGLGHSARLPAPHQPGQSSHDQRPGSPKAMVCSDLPARMISRTSLRDGGLILICRTRRAGSKSEMCSRAFGENVQRAQGSRPSRRVATVAASARKTCRRKSKLAT